MTSSDVGEFRDGRNNALASGNFARQRAELK